MSDKRLFEVILDYNLFLLIFCFLPTHSIAIEFTGKFLQGHFIIGQTDPTAKIIIDKNYIDKNLDNLVKDTDLSKFIL